MADDDLSQYDIDRLFENIANEPSNDGIEETTKKHDERLRNLGKQLASAVKRYDFALQNGEPYHIIKAHRDAMHYYAFKNWLMKRNMDKEQYYALVRKEMRKRGMR